MVVVVHVTFLVPERGDIGCFPPMSPGCDFPDICRGDVLVRPFPLAPLYDSLEGSGYLRPVFWRVGPPDCPRRLPAFLVPPFGIKAGGGSSFLHRLPAGRIDGEIYFVHLSVDVFLGPEVGDWWCACFEDT